MAYGNFNQRQSFSPVKVGDELDVKIEAVGEKGDGICKKDGFVLFVPGAKEGQEVRIKVTKVLRRVGFAEIVGAEGKKAKKSEEESEDPEEEIEAEETEELEEAEEDMDEKPQSSDDEESKDEEEYEDSENFGEDGEEQR